MVSPEYYFISDLHIGGEENFTACDFEAELIDFLQLLESQTNPTELIIIGDAFSFWEMTRTSPITKLKTIIQQYPRLFDQFKRTGEKIKITLIPGNHDYELACYADYKSILQTYNIDLEEKEVITRSLLGRTIWIEHGNQHDNFNRIDDFGNPYVTPIGYYIVSQIVDSLVEKSRFGKYRWLKDIESVYPNEAIPHWFFSNYFYKEMSIWLRWILLPFLLLLSVSFIILISAVLERVGIVADGFFSRPWLAFLQNFGFAGEALNFTVNLVIFIDTLFLFGLILVLIPLSFVFRDIQKTLRRYGFKGKKGLKIQKQSLYLQAAQQVFERNPDVFAFVYGHTHQPSLTQIGSRYVLNTGSWLKKLKRISAIFRFLPAVYYPSFQLNYFKIFANGDRLEIIYEYLPKQAQPNLTPLEKLAILGRRKSQPIAIPHRTVV
ncbi:metallophosphoesterase [Myxosarcina sp. GI1]|uniref:metallophosphoesterase n=1 Tax=Myxosarcina sp. GI1 TaxID=1541065 RepID=UPI00055BCCD8|nr:metallophosphoesterase [Myxosarcina sp. GI1]